MGSEALALQGKDATGRMVNDFRSFGVLIYQKPQSYLSAYECTFY